MSDTHLDLMFLFGLHYLGDQLFFSLGLVFEEVVVGGNLLVTLSGDELGALVVSLFDILCVFDILSVCLEGVHFLQLFLDLVLLNFLDLLHLFEVLADLTLCKVNILILVLKFSIENIDSFVSPLSFLLLYLWCAVTAITLTFNHTSKFLFDLITYYFFFIVLYFF